MKLTTEQIEYIDETLVLNSLIYDDIKLEVTDHIASEIEVLMEENTLSFEENLHLVIDKWKPQLQPTTYGLLLGNHFTGPKIAMDKFASATKTELKGVGLLAILITVIILAFFSIFQNIGFVQILRIFIKTVLIAGAILSILGRIILLKTKVKSVYSVLFKKRLFFTLFFPLNIIFGFSQILLLNRNLEIRIVSLLFPLVFAFFMLNNLRFLIFHFQFEKKLTLSKR